MRADARVRTRGVKHGARDPEAMPPPAPKGQMRTNERRVVSVSLLPPLRRASLAPSLTQPGEMLRDQESTCHRAGPSFRDSGVLGARGGGC